MKLTRVKLRQGVFLGSGSVNTLPADRFAFEALPALLLAVDRLTGEKWGIPWAHVEPFIYEEDDKSAKPAGRGSRE
jgi:hypothetical protein